MLFCVCKICIKYFLAIEIKKKYQQKLFIIKHRLKFYIMSGISSNVSYLIRFQFFFVSGRYKTL